MKVGVAVMLATARPTGGIQKKKMTMAMAVMAATAAKAAMTGGIGVLTMTILPLMVTMAKETMMEAGAHALVLVTRTAMATTEMIVATKATTKCQTCQMKTQLFHQMTKKAPVAMMTMMAQINFRVHAMNNLTVVYTTKLVGTTILNV